MRVIRVPPSRLDAFVAELEDRAGQHRERSGEHEAFRIEMGRWELVGYATGKVVVQDEDVMPVIEEVLEQILPDPGHTVVGSDETGKGECLGPLVATACAVAPDERAELVALGVMDSKELSNERVLELAPAIDDRQPSTTVVVSPERFNELFAELKREGKGLNDLVAWAHARAIGDLLDQLEDSGEAEDVHILVDEFDRVRTQARASRAFDVDRYPLEQRPRAEDEIAVAAASVLAKAARERWIDAFERREGIAVRSLTREDAREHPDRASFAKVDWL